MTDVSNVKDWASKAKNDLTQKLNELHHKQKGRIHRRIDIPSRYLRESDCLSRGMNPEEALAANKSIIEEMIKTYADTGLSKTQL